MSAPPQTLVDKIFDAHVVGEQAAGEPALLYVDLHLVHEVTSPQAFDGLRLDVVRTGHGVSLQLSTTLAEDWGSSSLKARW